MPTHGTATEYTPSKDACCTVAASSHGPNLKGTKLKPQKIPKPKALPQSPALLADVAFLDISDVCAAARMSASWIHDEVRAGRCPQPMRFGPRCSRWRSAEVRAWLIARAKSAAADTETAALLKAPRVRIVAASIDQSRGRR
jgi:predicted DNA-binding transcriptional regulator AlpA